MTVALYALSIDCSDAEKLAGFWSAVLGRPVRPGATAESATVEAGGEAGFAAAGSKDKTLRVFTVEEGGSEHVNADGPARQLIVDWFAQRLGTMPKRSAPAKTHPSTVD
jgi:hypothetical protein